MSRHRTESSFAVLLDRLGEALGDPAGPRIVAAFVAFHERMYTTTYESGDGEYIG